MRNKHLIYVLDRACFIANRRYLSAQSAIYSPSYATDSCPRRLRETIRLARSCADLQKPSPASNNYHAKLVRGRVSFVAPFAVYLFYFAYRESPLAHNLACHHGTFRRSTLEQGAHENHSKWRPVSEAGVRSLPPRIPRTPCYHKFDATSESPSRRIATLV